MLYNLYPVAWLRKNEQLGRFPRPDLVCWWKGFRFSYKRKGKAFPFYTKGFSDYFPKRGYLSFEIPAFQTSP